jgi:predicted DNA-binding protein (MmcQ/YjbR family)
MSRKTSTHPADVFSKKILNHYPNAIELADTFRRDRARFGDDYPDWCDLPTALASVIITGLTDEQTMIRILKQQPKNSQTNLAAALIWMRGKMIYRFDDTLADILAAQPLDGKIPPEALHYLPYPCVYIERKMQVGDYETIGFFAWLDNENAKILRLHFLEPNGDTLPIPIPITGGTIDDSILEFARLSGERNENMNGSNYDADSLLDSPFPKLIAECINYLLYLCSEKPDMPDDTELRTKRSRDTYGNPKRAVEWDVGTRLGAALKKAKGKEISIETTNDEINSASKDDKKTHTSPRPHMRRAHWHSFWTGKRDSSERKLVLRWLPPITVNINDMDLPSVISPVSER